MKTFKQCPVCGTVAELDEVRCQECGFDYTITTAIHPVDTPMKTNYFNGEDYIDSHGKPIDLAINDVWIRVHDRCPNGVIGIDWDATIGCGRYELILDEDGKFHALTEYMDKGEDKEFTKAILNLLFKRIIIDE